MKWVTREKAKVDRIACPWLVKKFVDPKAEFLFVPREKVLDVAKEQGAVPYDSPGAELFHYKEGGDERCSFDAIIKTYKLTDPALLDMAHISNDDVDVVDSASDRFRHSMHGLKGVAGVLVSDERDLLFTANRGENTIGIFAAGGEQQMARLSVGIRPNGLAFDPSL